ncbi:MAG TPA: alpha/beta hydrolase-fold protein, partial [Caulobacter sp.]|nr:alpha/beta hydrolase-fold protein [Caulobacter sp.]
MIASLLIAGAAFAIAFPAYAGALTSEQPLTFGAGYQLHSAALNQDRRVNVSLPEGYDDPGQAHVRYPVLYLLDGGAGWQDFFHIAAMVRHGGLWGANGPVIVVGIESVDRRAEFTRPSSDPAEQKDFPTHGKSDAFRKFI